VGEALRESGVQVVELRASIIIGSGSLSFEMIRMLVERLPVMITPRWVGVESQPVAVGDVIQCLVAAARVQIEGSPVLEIGGAEVVSYAGIMAEYARQRGLRRLMIPVPVLTPRLSSLWLGLVTPLYARIGRRLIDSIRHPTVVEHPEDAALLGVHPVGFREAIATALRNEDREFAETRWSDSVSSGGVRPAWGGSRRGTRFVDTRSLSVPAPRAAVFESVARIGGETGWYAYDFLWKLRGALDLLAGGVGMRRGRPHPARIRPGDTLDFWRVESVEPGRRLRLAAEMKLPGRAWLEFDVEEDPARPESCTLRQTAVFDARGLAGLAYWFGLYPVHALVFRGMLRGIARAALRSPGLSPSSRRAPGGSPER
ncbi:MAG TPA: SDR family oxidoreductase, partial [Candidatus Saccharimonadales bacterium]|nr:SDR family oxidoreductase [Candidatus Saccharimonadales bacterium]